MVDSLQNKKNDTSLNKKVGRPKGFATQNKAKEKKPPKKIRKISLVFSDTQFVYLEELAKRASLKLTAFLTGLVEYHLDSKLLCGELEFNIPIQQDPNRELFLVLKALIYGELNENEKLNSEDVEKIAIKIGCEPQQIINLLERIE